MEEITEKDLPANVKKLWLKGLSAVQTGSYDFAVSLLQAVLKDSPGFLEARKLTRKCSIKIHGKDAKKKGLFGLSSGGVGMKLTSLAKKDPQAALYEVEKDLESDPINVALNEFLFEIALKQELHETAVFALETVRQNAPSHTKVLHRLAEHYLATENPKDAAEVYNDILEQTPNDGPAIKGSKDAAARASMKKQRWGEDTNIRDLMKDAGANEELEKASRSGLTREQLEEKIAATAEKYNLDQNNLAVSKQLAALYEQVEDWQNAHSFYQWSFGLSKGDVALEKKASEMQDRALEAEMVDLEASLVADPDNPELQAKLVEQREIRMTDQVEEAKRRIEQNPTDPQLRYELGSALYKSGDYTGAIPHLQQATRNPHIRTKVLLLLGRTFRAKKMFDLAIKQLSDALADLQGMDGTKKEVLYEKGLIHTEMNEMAAALESFKKIYEVDYSYRDVAQRVEASYSKD